MRFTLEGMNYFSAAEVAREVGVSRQTLWRWRQDGKIPSGRRYRDHQVVFTSDEFAAVREFAHRIEPIDATPQNQLKLFDGRRIRR
jgi:transcriptional regulator with XRE-family HTH domain